MISAPTPNRHKASEDDGGARIGTRLILLDNCEPVLAACAALVDAKLAAFCSARLARFKVPHHWELVDSFPLTASGKIQKYALRDRLGAPVPT